jgi:hypothetical protein
VSTPEKHRRLIEFLTLDPVDDEPSSAGEHSPAGWPTLEQRVALLALAEHGPDYSPNTEEKERARRDIMDAMATDLAQEITAPSNRPDAMTGPAPFANDNVLFLLRAAAGGSAASALVCESECGLWTLEVFVGTSVQDRAAERGSLLLAVHPENRTPYEGCTASVLVGDVGSERLLAEATIVNGELYAEVSLAGLDLQRHDKIWVRFGPKPTSPD